MPATNLKERIFTCDLHLFPEKAKQFAISILLQTNQN